MKKFDPKAKGKGKSRIIEVDFTGVETRRLVKEGDYLARPKSLEIQVGRDSGEKYILAKWQIQEGEFKDQIIYDNLSLQPQSLFKLRTVMLCSGLEVPQKLNKLNLDKLEEELLVGISVYHDINEGKKKAKVADYFPPSDFEEEDEEDEEDETEVEEEEEEAKPAKKAKKAKPEPEPEEEDEEDEEEEAPAEEEEDEEEIDLDSMSLKELKEFAKENEIKIPSSAKKDAEKIRQVILDAVSEDDEEDDED